MNRRDLNSAELETVKVSRGSTTVVTANEEVQTNEEATVYVKALDLFVTVKLLEDTPAVLSLGKLCEEHGYSYEWTGGQLLCQIKDGRKIQCHTAKYVPLVVPGLWTGSSGSASPTSPTSSSQDSENSTMRPATIRSESVSERAQGDLAFEPTNRTKSDKSDENELARGNPLPELTEWLQEFRENLAEERVPEHRDAPASSSRESPVELVRNEVPGKHSF